MWASTRILLQAAAAAAGGFRYVASDMDGTLLTPQHLLSDYTKETLRVLAQEKNIPFIFATGRMYADVKVVSDHLLKHFQDHAAVSANSSEAARVYAITSNGAVMHNAITGELIHERCIPPALVRELYTVLPASETRINSNIVQADRWYCRMNWEEMLQFYEESGLTFEVLERLPPEAQAGTSAEQHSQTLKEGFTGRVVKVSFTSWNKALLEELERLLVKKYSDRLTINFSASYCIDITASETTKGSGLRHVFAHITSGDTAVVDACMKQTVAFGDDLNDAPMLSSVGRGYIMGNCNPRLRLACPDLEVIDTNTTDATARKLRELFSIDSGSP